MVRLFLLLAILGAPIFAADLTFSLNSNSGSGSMMRLAPEGNPPCLAPACVPFSGTLTDTDTDLSFLQLDNLTVSFDPGNPSAGLSLDNTFLAVVPGLLSGDPNYATSGNPPNTYSGPLFGIDIAPQTPAGTYHATVTVHATGGTGDPDANGFTVSKDITVTVVAAFQSITFGPLPNLTLPASPFVLTASASSGLSVVYSMSTPGVCSVNAATLTPLAPGTCSVTAAQPGNSVYAAASPVTESFTISAASGGGGGAPPPPVNPLTVSPAQLTFNGAGSQTVSLSYPGGTASFSSNFNFNQGNGWLRVSPSAGTVPADVQISVNPAGLALGAYTGTVNFSAGGGIASVAVALNVTPGPQPTGGIANAASAGQAAPSVVSPGSYIAIYGTGLAGGGNPSATSLPLATTLNGASATLCGVAMPLLYAGAGQINAIVPQVPAGSTQCLLVVSYAGQASSPVQLRMAALQPGIYTVNLSGSGPGVVANALTGQLNSATAPAHAGDFLAIYATGLGAVQSPNGEAGPADGAAAPLSPLFQTQAAVTATVGGVDAPVSFAGLTPTFAGLYQVNVQVPQGVVPGSAVPVKISAGGAGSNIVTIVVQ
ncbi:MAG TPA: hypothetical protein VHC90_25055 [Bryobacteraceae bacterium]|nr:hypothetical protein [Bryobacteraceae bacterium]